MSSDSPNKSRSSLSFLFYLAILIILIYTFRINLFVIIVRLHAAFNNNPQAERVLGDYYQNNAQLSRDLAYGFYTSSLKKYQSRLSTASPNEKANIQLLIGRFYQCGRGVPQDLPEAKKWFDDALKEAEEDAIKSGLSNEKLMADIKQSIKLNEPDSLAIACKLETTPEVLINTFKAF